MVVWRDIHGCHDSYRNRLACRSARNGYSHSWQSSGAQSNAAGHRSTCKACWGRGRRSVEPTAERVCPGQTQQLRHFVSTSPWPTAPLEQVLRQTADALVGGKNAVLIVDDTALPKQGKHSVGVKRQHSVCGASKLIAKCRSRRPWRRRRRQSQLPCGCTCLGLSNK